MDYLPKYRYWSVQFTRIDRRKINQIDKRYRLLPYTSAWWQEVSCKIIRVFIVMLKGQHSSSFSLLLSKDSRFSIKFSILWSMYYLPLGTLVIPDEEPLHIMLLPLAWFTVGEKFFALIQAQGGISLVRAFLSTNYSGSVCKVLGLWTSNAKFDQFLL